MQLFAYVWLPYFYLECGLEPALLFGIDCWDRDDDSDEYTATTCVSLYLGPLVLSVYILRQDHR